VCPDHLDARLMKVWVEEQLKLGKVGPPYISRHDELAPRINQFAGST
jgi:hypothetical protein